MIIRSFHPGMIIETFFLDPGTETSRPGIRTCVVMSVHMKGLLVHPIMAKRASYGEHAVYTYAGHVACDLRNVIEAPYSYAVAQKMQDGVPSYAIGQLDEKSFANVREKSLRCAYDGLMKSERLKADPSRTRLLRQKSGIFSLQQPGTTGKAHQWVPVAAQQMRR